MWRCPFQACSLVFGATETLEEHMQLLHPETLQGSQSGQALSSDFSLSGYDDSSSSDSAQKVPSRELPDVSSIIDYLSVPEDPYSTVGPITDRLVLKLTHQTHLSDVRSLSLRETSISQFHPSDKLHLHSFNQLEHLDLSKNFISNLSGVAICRNLRVIRLDFNQIHSISDLFSLKKLEIVSIERNYLQSIRGFPAFPRLKELFLSHNHLLSEEEVIECLSEQSKLSVLSIESNPFMRRIRHMRYHLLNKLHLEVLDQEPITVLDYSIAASLDMNTKEMETRRRKHSDFEEIKQDKAEEMKEKLKIAVMIDCNYRGILAELKRKQGARYELALNELIDAVISRAIDQRLSIS